jgi:hypothetical protein
MAEVAGEVKLIFTADATSWSQVLDNAQKQLNKLKGAAQSAGQATRAEMNEARGSIMVLGEEFGVHLPRHVQKFVAGLPGVASAMSAAFNTVAVFAIGAAIFEAGKKVTEFVEKTRNAAREADNAIKTLGAGRQAANLEMDVTNAKLEEQIAKFNKKPGDLLKTALAEARVEAFKLGQELTKDTEDLRTLFEGKLASSWMDKLLGSAGGAGDLEWLDTWSRKMEDVAGIIDPAKRTEAMKQATAGELDVLHEEIEARRQFQQMRRSGTVQVSGPMTSSHIGPQGADADKYAALTARFGDNDQTQELARLKARHTMLQGEYYSADKTEIQMMDQQKVKVGEGNKAAVEEMRRAASERLQAARAALEQIKADHVVSFGEEASYWQKLADGVRKGSAFYVAAFNEANKARAAGTKQFGEQTFRGFLADAEEATRQREEGDRITAAITGTFVEGERAAAELTREQQRGARENFQNAAEEIEASERMGEAAIQIQAARGRLSRLAAAMGISELHQLSRSNWTAALGVAQNAGAGIGLAEIEKHNATVGQRAELDDAAVRSATALGALHDSAAELVAKFTDMPAHIRETLDQAVSSVNGAILKTITEPHARGQWKAAGKSIFTGVAGAGLNMAEGSIAKAFGVSGVGKLGTQANPMWVRLAAMNAAGAGVASLMSGVAGRSTSSALGSSGIGKVLDFVLPMIPHFATGGLPPIGMPSLIGENGPELFVPSGSGRIVPNDALGGTTHNWHIDARGSSDPAAVRAQVQRGILEAAPRISAGTLSAQRDMSSRKPSMSR